jgi:hypothetical protein
MSQCFYDVDKKLLTVPGRDILEKGQTSIEQDHGLDRIALKELTKFGRYVSFPHH